MQNQLRHLLQNSINSKIFPGCALGIVTPGESVFICEGNSTYDTHSTKVNKNTVYDVASITKAIPTSSLALHCIDKKIFSTESRLVDFVPEFTGSFREDIQVKHLLTQTLDFNFRLSAMAKNSPKEILDAILTASLLKKPGTAYQYANATSILLGMLIERATAHSLDKLAESCFFNPLKMLQTTFNPNTLDQCTIAPTEIDSDGTIVCGVVHDESARALSPCYAVGSAGLFSTVYDISLFLKMILKGGYSSGVRFLSENSINQMVTNQLDSKFDTETALGWELNQASYMGKGSKTMRFGKTGFTGCVVVVDLDQKKGFVFLTNHTFPRRFADRRIINSVRSQIADLVFR